MSIWDEIEKDDAERLERVRREMADEKAAWDALTPEQKAAETARIEAKFADVPDNDLMDDDAEMAGDPFDDDEEDDDGDLG
jgi:hypothetical protein